MEELHWQMALPWSSWKTTKWSTSQSRPSSRWWELSPLRGCWWKPPSFYRFSLILCKSWSQSNDWSLKLKRVTSQSYVRLSEYDNKVWLSNIRRICINVLCIYWQFDIKFITLRPQKMLRNAFTFRYKAYIYTGYISMKYKAPNKGVSVLRVNPL